MRNLLLASLLIVTGCATGSHIVTGTTRTAISPASVKIYTTSPTNAEVIAHLDCSNPSLYKQNGMDSVLNKLKTEAAALGANGVVVDTTKNSAWSGTEITGTAIYVP